MATNNQTVVAPASVTAGAATQVAPMGRKAVYLFGTLVGTWQLEISPDGVNFVPEGTALTAKGSVVIEKPCTHVRWNCTAFTSGTPTSILAGLN